MTRFSRYLVAEIGPLYGAGLLVLLLLLLGSFLLGVLADVLARGVPIALLAKFLLYKMPAAAGAGIPLALLFAALLGLTRLIQDREIRAALTLGLGPARFARPLLAIGAAIALLSFANNELIVPRAEVMALEVQKDMLLQSPETFVQEGTFFTDGRGRQIFIGALDPGGVFRDVTVIEPAGAGGPEVVIQAERGSADERTGVWNLSGVRFLRFRDSVPVLDATAETAVLPVRGLAAGATGRPDLIYLPLGALWDRIRENPERNNAAEWTALHRKFAEPLAAVAFAVFALAIALFTFRRETPLGFVSVLLLTFVYYATWSVAKLLGAQGTIPAYVAGWLPVALYLGVGSAVLALSWRR